MIDTTIGVERYEPRRINNTFDLQNDENPLWIIVFKGENPFPTKWQNDGILNDIYCIMLYQILSHQIMNDE